MLGSIIGGLFGIAGASKQADAAKDAADAQVKAAKIATEEQKRQFDAMMKRSEPQYQTGLSALNKAAFYAGVPVPGLMGEKMQEMGVPTYPGVDPFSGQIRYMDTLGVPQQPQQAPQVPQWAMQPNGDMQLNNVNYTVPWLR